MNKPEKQTGLPVPENLFEDKQQDPEKVAKTEVGVSKTEPKYKPWEHVDPTIVEHKKDNLHYRWVDQKKVREMRRQGYSPVAPSAREHAPASETEGSAVTIGGGDNVLMNCPKKEYEERQAYKLKDARERRAKIKQSEGKRDPSWNPKNDIQVN